MLASICSKYLAACSSRRRNETQEVIKDLDNDLIRFKKINEGLKMTVFIKNT